MKVRDALIGSAVVALLVLGGWYGWRWFTTPAPPAVPLEGISEETAAVIAGATQEVRRRPRSGKAWGELGLALLATGFREQAMTCLAHARRFDPAEPRWPYWQGATLLPTNPAEGITHLREALRLEGDRDRRAAILFALALPLVEEGRLDEAEQDLRALQQIDPDGPRLRFGLGLLAVARDDKTAAREHLGALAESPHARKRACSLLAALSADKGQAQAYRKRAAELPGDAEWPDVFQQELTRYRVDLSRRLATYREMEEQGRRDEAVEFLRNAVAEAPDEAVCFTLGTALLGRGELPEAEKAFRQALEFNPRSAKGHLILATVLLQRGEKVPGGDRERFEQAAASADRAIALQGELAYAHLIRGRALKRLGRTQDALAALRAAVLRGPEFAEMHQALGEALAEAGQVTEGLAHLEDAVRQAKPGDRGPEQALARWKAKAKKER